MATNKNTDRGRFAVGTQQVWAATKTYSWGIGFSPLVRQDKYSFRLIIKNKDEHSPASGEEWVVEVKEWWKKPGDKDPQGKQVVYVSGFLKERETKTERYVDHRAKELITTVRSGKVILETKVSPVATEMFPFRDKSNPDRIVFMEISFADGKEVARRYSFEKTLAVWKKLYAKELRDAVAANIGEPVNDPRVRSDEEVLGLLPFLTE